MMRKVQTHPNCIVAKDADGITSLIAPNPELQKWMDGCCFEGHGAVNLPKAPGVYRTTIEVWFSQGYSDGYPAPGESDWEFRLTDLQPIVIENFDPAPMIQHEDQGEQS